MRIPCLADSWSLFLAQEAQGVCMHVCECVHELGRGRDGLSLSLDEDQSGENLPSFWVGV